MCALPEAAPAAGLPACQGAVKSSGSSGCSGAKAVDSSSPAAKPADVAKPVTPPNDASMELHARYSAASDVSQRRGHTSATEHLPAPLSVHEPERLAFLCSLNILDTVGGGGHGCQAVSCEASWVWRLAGG